MYARKSRICRYGPLLDAATLDEVALHSEWVRMP